MNFGRQELINMVYRFTVVDRWTHGLFLFLILSHHVLSSPVAYIIQKNQPDSINHLATALIITERLLLTPKQPLSSLLPTEICILAVPSLKNLPVKYVRSNCIEMKQVSYFSLALIELQKDIPFSSKINAASVAILKKITPEVTKNCRMAFHTRDNKTEEVTAQGLTDVAVEDPCRKAGKGGFWQRMLVQNTNTTNTTDPEPGEKEDSSCSAEFFRIEVKPEKTFCMHDNGLPLYCGSIVMGMFWSDDAKNKCCLKACSSAGSIRIANLNTEEVYRVLRKRVRVPGN